MNKTFLRTTVSDDEVQCSWYDKNGKRCAKQTATHRHPLREGGAASMVVKLLTVKETDDKYGFMPYAQQQGYTIIDDAPLPHPGRITE